MLDRFGYVFIFSLAILELSTMPALAGNVTIVDGKTTWESTQCTAPEPPPALPNNPETSADALNGHIVATNAYMKAAQGYMNCIAREAQHDARATSQTVTAAGQSAIDYQRKQVAALNAPVRQ